MPVPRLYCRRLLCFASSLIPRGGCLRNPRSFTLHVHRHVPRPYKYAAASTPSLPIYSFSCLFSYFFFSCIDYLFSLTGVAFVFEATNLDDFNIIIFSAIRTSTRVAVLRTSATPAAAIDIASHLVPCPKLSFFNVEGKRVVLSTHLDIRLSYRLNSAA